MAQNFKTYDRDTPFLLPPSVQDWLPEGHLARFVVDVVQKINTRSLENAYAGRGSKAYHPDMLLALLFYGYATGKFSSRKLELATYESVAVRFICANTHPDHDTISYFRKRVFNDLTPLFVQILQLAHELGLLKLGEISLDGTKVKANASKHKAMSWKRANQLEKQLKREVNELMRRAEAADNSDKSEHLDIPEELKLRQDRLQAIEVAKEKIKARAHERYKLEKAEYDEKIKARQEKQQRTGKKPGGKPPPQPMDEPQDKDQINFTDEESRIMPTSGGGFDQTYNAQIAVDMDSYLIVHNHLTQHTNDKQEIKPFLKAAQQLPQELGRIEDLAADAGYFSNDNVESCYKEIVRPSISHRRNAHHKALEDRFDEPDLSPGLNALTTMMNRMQTKEGKAFYARRKSTVETVIGIIKAILGFRQFSVRGLSNTSGEWDLVCIAFNIKRLHALTA